MDRVILHSDMNCFYASVEMMLNPRLRDTAMAVGGDAEERHGIILAKSEKAKKAGVKTGMALWEARRLCPGIIIVPPHYEQYLKYSKLAHEIYHRYTDLVESYGMDECWLDVTGSGRLFGNGTAIAEMIRQTVKAELGLTVSIGVSYNKIFAKLGSDMKKPDAITVIPKSDFKRIVWPLHAEDLLFVGRATRKKLNKIGIKTIGELARCGSDFLCRKFGKNGMKLYRFANGLDDSPVVPMEQEMQIKSIGHGITCTDDLICDDEVRRVILNLTQDIGRKLKSNKLKARGVAIDIRDENLFSRQWQTKLEYATNSTREIAEAAYNLFFMRHIWHCGVRSVTVRAINLVSENAPMQYDFFTDYASQARRETLERTIDRLRYRFGDEAITYASLLGSHKMPGRHDAVIMPGMAV